MRRDFYTGFKVTNKLKADEGRSWPVVMCAMLLTGLVGAATVQLEETYLKNYSYFYDSVSYSFYNARLHARVPDEGRLALAAQEWLINPRHPLRTASLLIFAPDLLAHPLGHLATALPMLFIFLALLGWTIHRRTKHALLAVGCMSLFCATPIMFDPVMGFGAFWLDLPAALLIGGAALCLLNSANARDLGWLAGFAVLVSMAALSRYVAAVYAFVACAPVLAYYLFERRRKEKRFVKPVLLPLVVITAVIGISAGYFLVAHFDFNVHFYTVYAYGVGHSAGSALTWVAGFLKEFIGVPGLIVLTLIGSGNVALSLKHSARNREHLMISLWLASGIMLLLILGIGVAGVGQVTLYVLPTAYLAVVLPPALYAEPPLRRRLTTYAVVIVALALVGGSYGFRESYKMATSPPPDARRQKELDVALARALHVEGGAVVWMAYFREYAWIPTMEAFYQYGELPLPAGGGFFEDHEALWEGHYPNLSPAEVSERVYTANSKWVDVAVVFDDPAAAESNTWMDNPYSRTVARHVAERIRADENWSRAFVIESPQHGVLVGYRNLSSQRRGYEQSLRNLYQIIP